MSAWATWPPRCPTSPSRIGPGWADTLVKLASLVGREAAGGATRRWPTSRLPEAEDLLRWQPLARLAYTGPDGFPRVVPVGFLWRDGQVIVCTATTAPKVRALSARPHVALTIDTDSGTGSTSLLVRGVASIEIVDGVPAEYLEAAAKTMPAEQHQQFRRLRCGRSIRRWRASPSRRAGPGTTTSAPAASRVPAPAQRERPRGRIRSPIDQGACRVC